MHDPRDMSYGVMGRGMMGSYTARVRVRVRIRIRVRVRVSVGFRFRSI